MNEIEATRKKIKAKAAYRPALAPVLTLLDKQLRNFERETDEGKAALRPEIEKSIKKIEARSDGR